jgi:hypothetical protein
VGTARQRHAVLLSGSEPQLRPTTDIRPQVRAFRRSRSPASDHPHGGASSGPEPACDNALSSASGIRCSLSQWRRGHREPCSRRWVQSFYLGGDRVSRPFGECGLRAINREAHLP